MPRGEFVVPVKKMIMIPGGEYFPQELLTGARFVRLNKSASVRGLVAFVVPSSALMTDTTRLLRLRRSSSSVESAFLLEQERVIASNELANVITTRRFILSSFF